MKKLAITQFSILAFVSGLAAILTFFTGGLVKNHWKELFRNGEITLPVITAFSSHYGYLIPLVCCLASIICLAMIIRKDCDFIYVWKLYTLIVTVEIIGLALATWFNMFPALKIMYRVM